MLKSEIKFNLFDSITYGHKGKDESAVYIALLAPSVSQMSSAAKLKQSVMQSMQQGRSSITEDDREKHKKTSKNKKEEEQITGEDFVTMLSSSSVDYGDAMTAFKDLLCSGAGQLDGKEPLTNFLLDQIGFLDLEAMLGVYLENFLLRSLIQKMKKE